VDENDPHAIIESTEQMKLPDLTPVKDLKGGAPHSGFEPHVSSSSGHDHYSKMPPVTNILQILQITVLIGLGVSWWTGRENKSSVVDATQTMSIEEHAARLTGIDDRLNKIQDSQNQNTGDLHELMVKFRIMVELVDGSQKKPELHK
jgi:hypothetical protein